MLEIASRSAKRLIGKYVDGNDEVKNAASDNYHRMKNLMKAKNTGKWVWPAEQVRETARRVKQSASN